MKNIGKKKKMAKCQICDKTCSGNTKILDKRFQLTSKTVNVCSECFKHWSSGDDDYLYIKMKEKLNLNKTKDEIRLNE